MSENTQSIVTPKFELIQKQYTEIIGVLKNISSSLQSGDGVSRNNSKNEQKTQLKRGQIHRRDTKAVKDHAKATEDAATNITNSSERVIKSNDAIRKSFLSQASHITSAYDALEQYNDVFHHTANTIKKDASVLSGLIEYGLADKEEHENFINELIKSTKTIKGSISAYERLNKAFNSISEKSFYGASGENTIENASDLNEAQKRLAVDIDFIDKIYKEVGKTDIKKYIKELVDAFANGTASLRELEVLEIFKRNLLSDADAVQELNKVQNQLKEISAQEIKNHIENSKIELNNLKEEAVARAAAASAMEKLKREMTEGIRPFMNLFNAVRTGTVHFILLNEGLSATLGGIKEIYNDLMKISSMGLADSYMDINSASFKIGASVEQATKIIQESGGVFRALGKDYFKSFHDNQEELLKFGLTVEQANQ